MIYPLKTLIMLTNMLKNLREVIIWAYFAM